MLLYNVYTSKCRRVGTYTASVQNFKGTTFDCFNLLAYRITLLCGTLHMALGTSVHIDLREL